MKTFERNVKHIVHNIKTWNSFPNSSELKALQIQLLDYVIPPPPPAPAAAPSPKKTYVMVFAFNLMNQSQK